MARLKPDPGGTVVEAALKGGADRLLTEDMQHGQVIEGMRVENPFL